MPGHANPDADYDAYLDAEWLLFTSDQSRQQAPLDATAGLEIHRVLDVGCGGGQDMIPFARQGATCTGVDLAPESGVLGRRLLARHAPGMPIRFVTSSAEYLPFTAGAFDVVVCRVVIPYTDNRRALGEMSRVLRPGGILLLKTHNLPYYTRKFVDGIKRGSPLFSVHAARVLLSGGIFYLTGRQPRGGLLLRESFLTEGLLRRLLAGERLSIEAELPDSNALAKSYRIVKRPQ